jgi:hypothetical protein
MSQTTASSPLVAHAERELQLAGFYDEESDYGGMIPDAVLRLVKEFAEEGHSGGSASLVTALLERLLRFQPLTPLTSDPGEWNEVAEDLWQSRRAPHVFSEDAGMTWYSIEPRLSPVGDRVRDGGEMGVLVVCDHCGGSGDLHMLDDPPESRTPEGG